MTRVRIAALALLAFAVVTGIGTAAQQDQFFPDLRWRSIGPFRGGRTRAVAGVAGRPNVLYMAPVNGGVWRSDDDGRTWSPIFDGQPTQSIGAIAVAPGNDDVLYVGTGEGLHRPDLSVGHGVYRSLDGGRSWKHLGLDDAQQIGAIVVDPRDANRLLVAVLGHPYGPNEQRGVFGSRDGGATWTKVLYVDSNTGAYDLELDPRNPDVVYATFWESLLGPSEDNNKFQGTKGGLFKSSDGGATWRRITKGLPSNLVQIDVAVAPSDPSRLYATLMTDEPTGYMTSEGVGFYRSDDAGESWRSVTRDPRPMSLIGGGDLPVAKVDPKNPDVVYSASIVAVKSTDGGATWSSLRGAPGGDDYQNLWISPEDPNTILFASDQGAVVTVNGGRTWSSWYNQPTAQMYKVGITPTFPYMVCSGQQESGSACVSSRGESGRITFRDWKPVGASEYGTVTPDPLDPDLVFGAGRSEVSRYRWSTGQTEDVSPIPISRGYRTLRTLPLVFSPADPHVLYYAANVVFRTADKGNSWKAISPDLAREHPGVPASVGALAAKNRRADANRGAIYSLGPGFRDVNLLWAGTDDGLVWVTRDGGAHWTNVTPPAVKPWSKVTQIEASRWDDATAYVSVSALRIDDQRTYIFRTRDFGATWNAITAGIADAPANSVRGDPVRRGLLYAATENGVWVSFDEGARWRSLQINLPRTSIRDLAIAGNDLVAATHGRGFWILDDVTPLRQLPAAMADAGAFLFRPADAIRVRRSMNTDTPLPADEPAGENPPNGAVIDYLLGTNSSGPVTLEIVDSAGRLVRRWTSSDPPAITSEELAKQAIPEYWVEPPRTLPSAPGAHRWVWDLRYAPPLSTSHGYPISAVPHRTPRGPFGPNAAPGTYTVRLTANGTTSSQPLTMTMDPRVKIAPAEIANVSELEIRLADMISASGRALLEARSAREQAEKLASNRRVTHVVAAFRDELELVTNGPKPRASTAGAVKPAKAEEAGEGKTPQRVPSTLSRVNGDANSLYGSISSADGVPNEAQRLAIETLTREYAEVMQRWEAIRSTALPRLNRELAKRRLPEVRPVANFEAADEGENVE